MNKFPLKSLCQISVLFLLLAAIVLSALPYSVLALLLLMVMLFNTWRPLPPRINMVITVMAVFLLPLVLAPTLQYLAYAALLSLTTVQILTALTSLPVIYLLDYHLRQNAESTKAFVKNRRQGRFTTYTYVALFVSTLVMLLVSFILTNSTLLFTSIIFALYLLGMLIVVLLTIPRLPIDVSTIRKRAIAGSTVNVSLHASTRALIRVHCLIRPVDPWVKIAPHRFDLSRTRTELSLTITPPLAGPSHPQLQVSVIDSRGLIQVNQLIEPVRVHVIPRAKYARWLAMKYLEQTRGGISTISAPTKAIPIPKRGVEYSDSRSYQPGDQLKDIDWKHTLKLSQIIIKEYIEAGQQAAIIAANLSVSDAEEADKLAFNLITTALTLAHETIPTALAVYDHQRVVLTTAVTDPRDILKQTLSLVKDITSAEFTHRYLQLPNIGKLRQNIAQLRQLTSEPAQRLLGILDFEYRAIEKAAKNHPAYLALSSAAKYAPAPGIIIVVSQLNHDAEALLVTTEKLSKQQFTTLPIETAK